MAKNQTKDDGYFRLNANMPPLVGDALQGIRKRNAMTTTEVVRQAILLLDLVTNETSKGRSLVLEDHNGKKLTTITLLMK